MKRVLAALLTGTMVVATGCVAVQTEETEEVDKNETIVVYTNNGGEGREQWLVDRAAEEGYNVQVVHGGASEITQRLIAEKNNPLCDVIFGLNNIEYEKLKANDLLEAWEPNWTDGVDESLIDADGLYYPVTTTPLVLIGNAEYEDMPSDWIDLVDEKYKGLYQLHALNGGTAQTVYASIISRYPDPEGELGISEEGWEIAAAFLGNAHNIVEGEDSIGDVIDGTYPMDEHWASGVITEQNERDYKFQIMTPEVGEPFVVESVAIAKGTEKYDLCVDFLNWLGSSDIQLEWSNEFGTIPCQADALDNVSDDLKELMDMLTPQDLDWAFIAENIDAWVEKAELEFIQ